MYRGSGRSAAWRVAAAILLAALGAVFVGQAATADEPKVPENVAAYFATGLVPRLADLYGSKANTDPASTFDDTTKVGTIHRLLAWSPGYLAGKTTVEPTELTNTWIAPVTAKEGTILGLAAVWINPGSGIVELADFSRGSALVNALGRAPNDTMFVDDVAQKAWFATDGKTLTPLVMGTSGVTSPVTAAEYQKILRSHAVSVKTPDTVTNPGLLIAGITLGAVVLLLAIFILLPGRRRKEDRDEPDQDATVPDAVGDTLPVAEFVEASPTPTGPKRSFEPDPEPSFSKPAPRKAAPRKAAVVDPAEAKLAPVRATPAKSASTNPSAPKSPAAKRAALKSSAPRSPATKKPSTEPPSARMN